MQNDLLQDELTTPFLSLFFRWDVKNSLATDRWDWESFVRSHDFQADRCNLSRCGDLKQMHDGTCAWWAFVDNAVVTVAPIASRLTQKVSAVLSAMLIHPVNQTGDWQDWQDMFTNLMWELNGTNHHHLALTNKCNLRVLHNAFLDHVCTGQIFYLNCTA